LDTGSFSNAFTGNFSVTTNNNALLLVYTAPAMAMPLITKAMTMAHGGFNFNFSGPNGHSYKVLASTNIALPLTDWWVLKTGTFGEAPIEFTDAMTNSQKFFQVASP
jgi:hypothetical protein